MDIEILNEWDIIKYTDETISFNWKKFPVKWNRYKVDKIDREEYSFTVIWSSMKLFARSFILINK